MVLLIFTVGFAMTAPPGWDGSRLRLLHHICYL
jgi:hypothetical protein